MTAVGKALAMYTKVECATGIIWLCF